MAEEFEESQVIFQDDYVEDEDSDTETGGDFQLSSRSNKAKRKKLKTNRKSSVPVNIPENESRRSWFRYMDTELDGDDGEMVPPHVIVGRRVAGKMMAFSVCTGNGRTLKGRDLSEVRNSVLRMTGFLET
ncbi:hypothetical protein Salat_0345500 [Sesamum alatum]|uniref:Senescence regulator n=1 Tax=Sesamum alatum TaxID=300844 RepID=A0AAE2CZA1_9LAMI|nr:hypothetical protein Salat_0345500 [Sesamum alatum]